MSLTFLGVSCAVIFLYAFHAAPHRLMIGIAVGVSGAGLMVAVRAGYPPDQLGHGVMWVIYALTMGLTTASGGGMVTAFFSACLIPLFVATLDRPANVTRWTVAALAGVGVAAVYSATMDSSVFDANVFQRRQFRFATMAVTLLLVYSGALILDWARGSGIGRGAIFESRIGYAERTLSVPG